MAIENEVAWLFELEVQPENRQALEALVPEMIAETKAGKGKMPAFAGKLTDAQIKDAVAYVRTLQKK